MAEAAGREGGAAVGPEAERQVAQFVASIRWRELPAAVQRKARLCLLDNLAAVIGGSRARLSRIAAEFAARFLPGGEASILLQARKASAAGAAFANGCAANALDSDDSARYAYGHAGAQLFPTALALAEARGLSGARLLTGLVVGYEVAHRIGRCWHDDHAVYQACGSWGSVACAAVAAHLLDLPAEQARQALGIADYHAPNLPMMRDVAHPAMVKHGIGWAALTGIHAAELASCGFTGIPSLLAREKYAAWVADIGTDYLMVEGVAWKAKGYACCGWAHAAVEGARKLLERHRLDPRRIRKIRIETFQEAAALGTRLPESTEEAQFNLAWPVAAMLVDGEVGPEQTLEHRLGDGRIRELAAKVEVQVSEELNELCRLFAKGDPRGRFASEVTLELDDGKSLSSGRIGGGLSFPQPGWDEKVMEEKFHWLVDPVLGSARAGRLAEQVWRLETLGSVRELIDLVGSPP
jgi:2-methylcitrate dehydratase PrpD